MKTLLHLTTFLIALSYSSHCAAQDWSGNVYKYYETYSGYIVSNSGDTTRGFIEHNGRGANQKTCVFYTDATKKDKKKYKAGELKAYMVADKIYRSLTFSSMLGKNTSFALMVKPGRVSEFAFYERNDVPEIRMGNETAAEFDARLYKDEIVWQKLDENPVYEGDLLLGGFAKKVSKMLSDYPELSEKVANKEKGYGILNSMRIMDEYNTWWATKK